MIPKFPTFSNLDISHKAELESITETFEPYSDFNFTSLFVWNTDNSTQISTMAGNLVIKLPDYLTDETVYSVLGVNDIDNSLKQLLSITPELGLIPQITVECITNPTEFTISETPEHFDYIFSLEQLAYLPGQQYRGKRKSIYRFTRAYEDLYEAIPLDLTNPAVQQDIENTFERWTQERGKSDKETVNERLSIHKLLQYADALDLICLGITLNGQMMGFSINEVLNKEFILCHFQKTILTHNGIDVFLTSETAKDLFTRGYRYVNWEQDLGLPGLRELKTSYKPTASLKKYSIRQAAN